ncbi:MAG: hypothetical protein A2163_09740 [Actinobacteria bacterium RBG_13_35_12]|nr:MAG: hypothetical protein A2163_09740 [Actinobacteria bacterium RBG_13_35_12]
MKNTIEIRTFTAEIRADEGEKSKIKGTASVFNVMSEDLGGFKEIIEPSSFGSIIYENDIKALINHDPNLILGRNQRSKTLRLVEDEQGLKFEVDPPNTSYANDLIISMARGDIDQCSFAFRVAEDGQWWETINGIDIRHITKFAEMFDVAIVVYPAFPQTHSELFGHDILTPKEVYAEYCSISRMKNGLILHEKQESIKRAYNKRNNTIKLLEKL